MTAEPEARVIPELGAQVKEQVKVESVARMIAELEVLVSYT